MPLSALPPELQDVENHFPDDDQYGTNWFGRLYRWYQKKTKTWLAFSYRCTESWARWRKTPIVLFAAKGHGPWRWESEGGELVDFESSLVLKDKSLTNSGFYLSRVQYYTRWHFAIQWPLLVSFHFYTRSADVPIYGFQRPDSDGKLWFFYWSHFDADFVYWMITSLYLGRNWK